MPGLRGIADYEYFGLAAFWERVVAGEGKVVRAFFTVEKLFSVVEIAREKRSWGTEAERGGEDSDGRFYIYPSNDGRMRAIVWRSHRGIVRWTLRR